MNRSSICESSSSYSCSPTDNNINNDENVLIFNDNAPIEVLTNEPSSTNTDSTNSSTTPNSLPDKNTHSDDRSEIDSPKNDDENNNFDSNSNNDSNNADPSMLNSVHICAAQVRR